MLMVVKCTLMLRMCIILLLLGTLLTIKTIATARGYTSNLPKTCYYGLKSGISICNYLLATPLLAYISVRNVHKKGIVAVHFIPNYNKQESTSKFIFTPLILGNK